MGNKKLGLVPVAIILSVLFLSSVGQVRADMIVTNCANDSQLSAGVANGGIITFNCGTATIPWSGTKTVAVDTIIDGEGKITFNGGGGHRLFSVNNGVTLTLNNVTLMLGYNPDALGGAGVQNNGHLVVDNVTMHSMVDSAYNGGAIGTIGPVEISNSTFYNNKATNGGAIYGNGSAAVISIENSRFYENLANNNGGVDQGLGGVVYVYNGARVDVENSDLYENDAYNGGAIYVTLGSIANVTTSQVRDNFAEQSGGGIFSKGTTMVSDSHVLRNRSDYGGGIDNEGGGLTVDDSIISGNSANVAGGGGIASSFGAATLTRATVSGNFASGDAGGVENFKGIMTLTNVTISGNNSSSGGGMWNLFGGTANLNNVTFLNNRALGLASGIGNSNDPNTHLYLRNVLIGKSKGGDNCVFQKAPDVSDHNLSSDGTCNFGAGRDNVKFKVGPLETNGGFTLTHRFFPGTAGIDQGVTDPGNGSDQRSVMRPLGTAYDVGAVEFVPSAGTPTKSKLLAPSKNAQLTGQTVRLDWAYPDCVKKFSVIVRRDTKNGPIAFSKSGIKQTEVTTTALAANHNYFWQVTACNGPNCVHSKWGKFRVQ